MIREAGEGMHRLEIPLCASVEIRQRVIAML